MSTPIVIESGRKSLKDSVGADTYNISNDATIVTIGGSMKSGDIVNIEGLSNNYLASAAGRTITLKSTNQIIKFQLDALSGLASVRFADGDLTAMYSNTMATLGVQKLRAIPEKIDNSILGELNSKGAAFSNTTITPPPVPPKTATYNISALGNISEGETATFKIETTGIAQGTQLSYLVTGTGNAVDRTNSGLVEVDSQGFALVNIKVPSNTVFGDSGTLKLELANQKASSQVIKVADATPAPTVPDPKIEIVPTGATLTLTEKADTLTGTSKNDLFIAPANTLRTISGKQDRITDKLSTDKDVMKIVYDSDDSSSGDKPIITGIETLDISFDLIAGAAFDATNVLGATINLNTYEDRPFAGDVTINGVKKNNIVAKTGVTALTINDLTSGYVNVGDATELTLTPTAGQNTHGFDIRVNGDLMITSELPADTTRAVIALTATKDSEVTLSGTPGSKGYNQIQGAGLKKITVVTDLKDLSSSPNVRGVSQLKLTAIGTGKTIDLSNISKTVELSSGESLTYSSVNGHVINLMGEGESTLAPKSPGVSSASIYLSKPDSSFKLEDADQRFGSLKIYLGKDISEIAADSYAQAVSLNVNSDVTINSVNLKSRESLALTGEGNVRLTDLSLDRQSFIDAGQLKGGLRAELSNVGATDAGATVVFGLGRDLITGDSEKKDTFIFTRGALDAPTDLNFDTIDNYEKNLDTIKAPKLVLAKQKAKPGKGVATIGTLGLAEFNANDDSLSEHITAVAAAQQPVEGAATIWKEGSDAYLFISDGKIPISKDDILIKLIGVDPASLTISGNAITAIG